MRRQLFGCAFMGLVSAATAAAQSSPAQADVPATVEGCLHREADVPGRKPTIAERVGISEDYVLTDTRLVKGGSAASVNDASTAESRKTMYDVQGLSADQLKSNLNKRVQIDGTLAHQERASKGPEPNGTGTDLVELKGNTIRSVSGECPR